MEPTRLYLDTARLGRMSSSARHAHADFARLAGDEAGSLFFERFLRDGAEHWSTASHHCYSGLADWHGVGNLKAKLRHLAGAREDLPLLLVNRTAQLMKLAGRLFFGPCTNLLLTDLGWPPYHRFLTEAARRAGRRVTTVPLLDRILRDKITDEQVVRLVSAHGLQAGCDGVFLGAVSHLGIRLPVERIVRTLRAATDVRFALVDGAQEFCHAPANLCSEYCDLYLTGCHKWLAACNPMGLGFYGRRRTAVFIERTVSRLLNEGFIDDPLLRLSTQLDTGRLDGHTETVSLVPLFSAHGATKDALCRTTVGLADRLANAMPVTARARAGGWTSCQPADQLRTGILLVHGSKPELQRLSGEAVRERFARHGVALTGYDGGWARLSLPDQPLEADKLDLLEAACAG